MANARFDTKVQQLKNRVLTEVARAAYDNQLMEKMMDIPHSIVPGKKPTMRCCVYKERAILGERVKLAVGGDRRKNGILEVIDIACDECPVGGYEVTSACRGCLTHRCVESCPKNAISLDHRQRAHIDKSACIECGRCAKVCPYTAIKNSMRPCMEACNARAITMDKDQVAEIDYSRCVHCGACAVQCPFGAISEKSWIVEAVHTLVAAEGGKNYPLVALVAPAIVSQFTYAKPGQVVEGIRRLGFSSVMEAALGADMVADQETDELLEKGFLFSSCCPSFVDYVRKNYPDLSKHISHNLSPMATIAKRIKEKNPETRIIFIGPCTAKKSETQLPSVRGWIDLTLTFEELQALFDSRDLAVETLPESALDNASPYGRGFARSGGVANAIKEALKEKGREDFEYKPLLLNGMAEFRSAMLRAQKGVLGANFVEGMACVGGCVGGAGCLTHDERKFTEVDKSAKAAIHEEIKTSICDYEGTCDFKPNPKA